MPLVENPTTPKNPVDQAAAALDWARGHLADPASTNPASTNPAITNPASTNPASTNPASTNPASTDPVGTDLPSVELMKARPWAATWRLRTPDRVAYLKVSSRRTGYEAALMPALARIAPALIPAVVAADPQRGRLLLADAGAELTDQRAGRFEVSAWTGILPRFATLQRAVEPFVVELTALGVPDERPERFTAVLAELLQGSAQLAALGPGEHRRLRHRAVRLRDDLAETMQTPIPPSIQHGDLHPGNVGIGTDGKVRFFDFGDATVAHPFSTLHVPLRVARAHGADAAQLDRLRDVYLEAFTDLAPAPRLRRILTTVLHTAPLLRATAWDRALDVAPAPHNWDDAVVEHLRELP